MRRDDPGPYSLDVLRALPAPAIFTRDPAKLKARYVKWFEQASGRTLYPMQVEMLLIEALTYAMSVLGEEAQMTVEQHLVALATSGLDQLGANRSTPRLPASKARVTLSFTLSQKRATAVTIPEQTRVSAGSSLTFLTLSPVAIAPGALSVTVTAEASEAGAHGNGFLPGQLSAMLDPIAGVSVANITSSEGGADGEGDDAYRLRVANAFERISSAGGRGWYREETLKVSPAIIDVAVIRPQPCYIDLYPLTSEGAAGPDLCEQIKAAFNTAENLDFRFGDEVTVRPAEAVTANPVLTVRMHGASASIRAQATAAAQRVLDDCRMRLGAIVAPSEIEERVREVSPLILDAEVTGLPFKVLGSHEYLDADLTVVMENVHG